MSCCEYVAGVVNHVHRRLSSGTTTTGLCTGHLELGVTRITDSLRLLVILHQCLLRRAVIAENLSAISAVVFPVGQREAAAASHALRHLGVVGPLATSLLGQLDLDGLVLTAQLVQGSLQ